MAASLTIDALRRQILHYRPGATVWGLGDAAHAARVSDHNLDDTAGVRAAQQDSDTKPEYRAIDVKIDEHFTRDDARALVADVTSTDDDGRLFYAIFEGKEYHSNGLVLDYDGDDPHDTHVHVSALADDDEDSSQWTLTNLGGAMALQEDLDAYVIRTAGGDAGTSAAQRAARTAWRRMLGVDTAPDYATLVAAVAVLKSTVDELARKVDALTVAGGTPSAPGPVTVTLDLTGTGSVAVG